ncbi:MAG TPA: ABC transporter permease [Candidatus Onthousia faecipullorum]|uniref:Cell division protein FtsX n=1 Tax=Candidatus Onthousia faecipullorum TaxID=2840887 RepID=A0A9D1GA68_9FIRM|nr:ABC transporter permease [Candidatus Onthousia faecipullorum]
MKLFRMLRRSIRDAFKSVFRNFSLSLASISCITITLIIVAISIMVTFNVQEFTSEMEKDLTIVVFLDQDTTEEEINDIRNSLENMTNVESITYQNKDAIKEDMSKESDVFEEVMSTWSEEDNPLKDTFQVKVKDVEKISNTAKKIERLDNVSTVKYGEGMVDNLISAFEAAKNISYGMVIALVLVTVFLIINTIKLTIFSRKREISIMRLVGASNFTIKTPFIIEGMILGLLGSIIPILIVCFGYIALYNHSNGYLYSRMISLIEPEPFIYMVSGIVVVIGIIVGMIGSASAVRKYLKI